MFDKQNENIPLKLVRESERKTITKKDLLSQFHYNILDNKLVRIIKCRNIQNGEIFFKMGNFHIYQ